MVGRYDFYVKQRTNNDILYKSSKDNSVCVLYNMFFYLYLPPRENRIDRMNTTVERDHVDILCMGSSHMTSGLNPIQMYEDYGYATYIVAGGGQAPGRVTII